MSRSDRSERVALVAVVCTVIIFLIGLAAGNYYEERSQHHASTDEWPNLSALSGSPIGYQAICNAPIDKDHADLCQQWRSAEAATKAANYTEGQFWLGLIGAVGLFGTIAVAGYTLIETRRIGQAQVRAYLSIDGAKVSFRQSNLFGPYFPHVTLYVSNTGNSPALRFRWGTKIAYAYEGSAADVKGHGITTPEREGVDIRPQAKGVQFWRDVDDACLSADDVAAWRRGKLRVYIDVYLAHQDVFGEKFQPVEFFRGDVPARIKKGGPTHLVLAKGVADAANYMAELDRERHEREALRDGLRRVADGIDHRYDDD